MDKIDLTLTFDREHEILTNFLKTSEEMNAKKSIYDSVDTAALLEHFYGEQPPTKVEDWSLRSLEKM